MRTSALHSRISFDPKRTDDAEDTAEQKRPLTPNRPRGGDGLGVARQQEVCRQLAHRLGWRVVAEFEDNDTSAYSGKRRPGFEALLDAMKNSEASGVVVWHTDRLYRSLKDLERLIDVAQVAGVQIESIESGQLDLRTSAGKMVARILGSVAHRESKHHDERRRAANLQRAKADE